MRSDSHPNDWLISQTLSNAIDIRELQIEARCLRSKLGQLRQDMDETPDNTNARRLTLHSLDYWQIALGAIAMWAALGFKEPPEWVKLVLMARLSGN